MEPYLALFVSTAIDASGVPFPGRLILVAAGALAAAGRVNLAGVIVAGAAGAVAGDHLWYFASRLAAGRLTTLYRRLAGRRRSVGDATAYLRRHHGLTIVIGRFVAAVRILVWPVARAHGIGYWRFLAWDLAGAGLWVTTFVLPGYLVGPSAIQLLERFGVVPVAIVFVVAGLLTAGLAVWWRRRRRVKQPKARAVGTSRPPRPSPARRRA